MTLDEILQLQARLRLHERADRRQRPDGPDPLVTLTDLDAAILTVRLVDAVRAINPALSDADALSLVDVMPVESVDSVFNSPDGRASLLVALWLDVDHYRRPVEERHFARVGAYRYVASVRRTREEFRAELQRRAVTS